MIISMLPSDVLNKLASKVSHTVYIGKRGLYQQGFIIIIIIMWTLQLCTKEIKWKDWVRIKETADRLTPTLEQLMYII